MMQTFDILEADNLHIYSAYMQTLSSTWSHMRSASR